MGDPKGFLKYAREGPKRKPVELRVLDWKEMYEPIPEDKLKIQGARCMDCGVPFCQGNTGCPVVNLIPEWNDLVYRGRWKDALKALHTTNNFPEFTGRLCPAPCEGACVLGINSDPVSIRVLEWNIIDRGFNEGLVEPAMPVRKTGKTVAIVGFRTGRPRRRAATGAGGSQRDGVRKGRSHRRVATLRHSRLQDGKVGDRPAAGTDEGRRRRIQVRRHRREGPHRRAIAPAIRRGWSDHGCRAGARSAHSRPRAEGHPLRHGVSHAAEQADGRHFRLRRTDYCQGQTGDHHRRRRYRI